MGNTTNNSFEQQWQKAFDDAYLAPSEAVWERIEVDLQNTIPPKSGNSFYYIGTISAVIISIGLWFIMSKKEDTKQPQVIENKVFIPEEIIEKTGLDIQKKPIIKPKDKTQVTKVFIPENPTIIQSDIIFKEPENQERIITDSIDFINPIMATPKISSELANPSINIPFENTPYYEIPRPKAKKKPIWNKVRISGGIGIYQ